MYCVKCGVELADSENKCPLCNTPVYYPEREQSGDRPYPELVKAKDEIGTRGLYFIISFLCLIAAAVSLVCDISINREISFSGYVLGGIILVYSVFILPGWFKRPSPAIFIPSDFAVAALFVAYINYTVGGDWFFSLALPIVGASALIITAFAVLCYYLRCGYLYIFGGASIALGLFSVLIEYLLIKNLAQYNTFYWSVYPALTLTLIGIMLIVIAIVPPFRESLKKIFTV